MGDWDWHIIRRLTGGIVRAAADRDYTHSHTHTEVTHKNKQTCSSFMKSLSLMC